MLVFYSATHQQHHPPFEIFDGGEKVPNFEVPERAERILTAIRQTTWASILAPADFGLEPILGETIWDRDLEVVVVHVDEDRVAEPGFEVGRRQRDLKLS